MVVSLSNYDTIRVWDLKVVSLRSLGYAAIPHRQRNLWSTLALSPDGCTLNIGRQGQDEPLNVSQSKEVLTEGYPGYPSVTVFSPDGLL